MRNSVEDPRELFQCQTDGMQDYGSATLPIFPSEIRILSPGLSATSVWFDEDEAAETVSYKVHRHFHRNFDRAAWLVHVSQNPALALVNVTAPAYTGELDFCLITNVFIRFPRKAMDGVQLTLVGDAINVYGDFGGVKVKSILLDTLSSTVNLRNVNVVGTANFSVISGEVYLNEVATANLVVSGNKTRVSVTSGSVREITDVSTTLGDISFNGVHLQAADLSTRQGSVSLSWVRYDSHLRIVADEGLILGHAINASLMSQLDLHALRREVRWDMLLEDALIGASTQTYVTIRANRDIWLDAERVKGYYDLSAPKGKADCQATGSDPRPIIDETTRKAGYVRMGTKWAQPPPHIVSVISDKGNVKATIWP
ncbi:hypothetical protein HK101_004302 [Irineochytrium annulatum]|nr:hypothetical protein HK101_004302 [Irineochytrium annulatum]